MLDRASHLMGATAWVVLAAMVSAPGIARAEGPAEETRETVLVNDLKGIDVSKNEALQVSGMVRSATVQTQRYTVVSRDQMEAILEEQLLQTGDVCDEASCQVEMGMALGASKMIAGSVGKLGKAYTLNLRLIDITTTAEEASVSEQCLCEIHELQTVATDAVRKLFGMEPLMAPGLAAGAAASEDSGGVTSRWWFWTLIGVAVIGGTGAALWVTRPEEETRGASFSVGTSVP